VVHAHELRYAVLLELGSRDAYNELETMAQLASTAHQPRLDYYILTRRAGQAIMLGRLDEAEHLAGEAVKLGTAIGEPDTPLVNGCLISEITLAQGRYAEARAVLDALPYQSTDLGQAAWRSQLDVVEGNLARARAVVAILDEDFIARTAMGASGALFVAWLTRTIVGLGDRDAARKLYDTAIALAGTNVVPGGGVIFVGCISHHLGILAELFGDEDVAMGHLEQALAMHERLGAHLWTAQTQVALGALLVDRDPVRALVLLEAGRATAQRIGMPPTVATADVALARLGRGGGPRFERQGTVWTVTFAATTAHVAHCKGLHDVAALVARPHEEVHVVELVAVDEAGGADRVLDDRARREYKHRLDELERELADADAGHDLGRAEALHAERDALVDQLSAAVGLGGRARRLGDPGERARKAVSARIRDAIARIDAVHPALAAHLRESVTTGTFCSYQPR
jgi:tetratricopeptide (TPR) repeat protein